MMIDTERKETNRKKAPYSYHFEDGMLDFFIGAIMLQLGLSMLFDQLGAFGAASYAAAFLICLILYIAIIIIWKKLVLPRISSVTETPVKRKNFRFFFRFNAVFLLIMIAAAIVFSHRLSNITFFSQTLVRVLPMVIVLGVGAYLLGLSRIFLYAALIVFAFPFGGYLAILTGWPFIYPIVILAASAAIFITGSILAFRFFKAK